MGLIKGIGLSFDLKSWGLGFYICLDRTFPELVSFNFGPICISINRWQYFKNGFIDISEN